MTLNLRMKGASNQDKLTKLSQEIRDLRRDQKSLTDKIDKLSEELHTLNLETNQSQGTKETKVTLDQCRSSIGKTVRIINPKPGETDVGQIYGVGQLYVTVQLPNQTLKRRVASNLRLISP